MKDFTITFYNPYHKCKRKTCVFNFKGTCRVPDNEFAKMSGEEKPPCYVFEFLPLVIEKIWPIIGIPVGFLLVYLAVHFLT